VSVFIYSIGVSLVPVSPEDVVPPVFPDPESGVVPVSPPEVSVDPVSPDPVFPVSVDVVVSPPVEFPESSVVEGVLPLPETIVPCPFITDSN
jgi:hypothetical protein